MINISTFPNKMNSTFDMILHLSSVVRGIG